MPMTLEGEGPWGGGQTDDSGDGWRDGEQYVQGCRRDKRRW